MFFDFQSSTARKRKMFAKVVLVTLTPTSLTVKHSNSRVNMVFHSDFTGTSLHFPESAAKLTGNVGDVFKD